MKHFLTAVLVMLVSHACLAADPSAESAKTVTVSADGTGDFKTVQSAIDSVPDKNKSPVVIQIKPGTYKERLLISRNKPFIKIVGEDPKTTILTWNWNASSIGPDGKAVGTSGSASTKCEASDFTAENVTFENSAGDTGQAVALSTTGDRQVYRNCRMLGWQDTLFAGQGRQYFVDCYIEGRVDFIFGGATAVFDKCQLHSKNGGSVTAASTAPESPFGYVFLDCKLTGDGIAFNPATTNPATTQKPGKGSKLAILGRPWRPNASVTFIRCQMGDHIRPEGWNNWGREENEKTARYAEYGSTGPGAMPDKRVPWAKKLSKEDAEKITPQSVLAGKDNWNPGEGGKGHLAKEEPKVLVIAIDAKSAQIKGENARLDDNGGHLGWWSDTDTSFEWQTDLQPGVYVVAVSYSVDEPRAGSELELKVGENSFRAVPAATAGWEEFDLAPFGEVTIKQAGPITVTLRALSKKDQFIANVKEIKFTQKTK